MPTCLTLVRGKYLVHPWGICWSTTNSCHGYDRWSLHWSVFLLISIEQNPWYPYCGMFWWTHWSSLQFQVYWPPWVLGCCTSQRCFYLFLRHDPKVFHLFLFLLVDNPKLPMHPCLVSTKVTANSWLLRCHRILLALTYLVTIFLVEYDKINNNMYHM